MGAELLKNSLFAPPILQNWQYGQKKRIAIWKYSDLSIWKDLKTVGITR